MEKEIVDMSLDQVIEYVCNNYPDYTVVKTSDFESSSKETYKYLYENVVKNQNQISEELHNLTFDYQDLEKKYIALKNSYDTEKSINESLDSESRTFIQFINKYINQDIIVSDVSVYDFEGNKVSIKKDDIVQIDSMKPGIYGFKRPAWFSILQCELNKENLLKKNRKKTEVLFRLRTLFNKKIISAMKYADEYDNDRREKIASLLLSNCSNEEKYLRYIVLCPGISEEYQKLLFSASDIGLDANIIIELFEQPADCFNIDVIKRYITFLKKNSEFKLKQELAEELIRGSWSIKAKVNDSEQIFQLVPYDEIKEISDKISAIYDSFINGNHSSTQNHDSDDVQKNDLDHETIDYSFLYEPDEAPDEEFSSSIVNMDFDDSDI